MLNYHKFGKLNWNVSALWFGSMRLPIIGGDTKNINQPEAVKMIRHRIDNCVNYVDTVYDYHEGGIGESSRQDLEGRLQGESEAATKLPGWLVECYENFDKVLNEQLERLGTTHIDYYLLHALNPGWWPKLKELGVFE